MTAFNMTAGIPRLFRTYKAPAHANPNCTIWEAARATSAAPTFFDRITISELGIGQPFIDGGLGRNNPTAQVLEEAKLIFGSRQVACIVSIGTGQTHPPGIPPPNVFQRVVPLDVVRALQGIATDCDGTAQEISRRFTGTTNVYFRFNVEQGLQNVGIAQWERLAEVMAHTGAYMSMAEVDQSLTAVVHALQGKPKVGLVEQFSPH
jgi:predicted acylesterase/phospholipase RssA